MRNAVPLESCDVTLCSCCRLSMHDSIEVYSYRATKWGALSLQISKWGLPPPPYIAQGCVDTAHVSGILPLWLRQPSNGSVLSDASRLQCDLHHEHQSQAGERGRGSGRER